MYLCIILILQQRKHKPNLFHIQNWQLREIQRCLFHVSFLNAGIYRSQWRFAVPQCSGINTNIKEHKIPRLAWTLHFSCSTEFFSCHRCSTAAHHTAVSAEHSAACLALCPDSPGASLSAAHLMLVTTARDITGGGGGGGPSQVTPGLRNINTRSSDTRYQCREQHQPVNTYRGTSVSSWWTSSDSRRLSWTPTTSAPATWRGWGRCCLATCRTPRGTCHSWRSSSRRSITSRCCKQDSSQSRNISKITIWITITPNL